MSPSTKVVVVLATLDTKGQEAHYIREQIEAMGGRALLMDIGVVGASKVATDVAREDVAAAGVHPSRRSWRTRPARKPHRSYHRIFFLRMHAWEGVGSAH